MITRVNEPGTQLRPQPMAVGEFNVVLCRSWFGKNLTDASVTLSPVTRMIVGKGKAIPAVGCQGST